MVVQRNEYREATDMNNFADFARLSLYPIPCLQFHAVPKRPLDPAEA